MKNLERTLQTYTDNGIINNLALRVGVDGRVLCDLRRGNVDGTTLFDMASLTKVNVTTPLTLMALERGELSLDDTVDRFFETKRRITVRQLLTHTSGIGNKALWLGNNTYYNVGQNILGFEEELPPDTDVIYSCLGFILLGKIAECIYGARLDECFNKFIAEPLGLKHTSFLPVDKSKCVNSNVEETLRGTVNDENCRFLGGIAGNAGLFSCIDDVARYTQCLLDGGAPLFSTETLDRATQNYTGNMNEGRGLGFLYVDGRYAQTGELFRDGAVGHCGHTGQSVFLDRNSGLYVIILSDATVSTVRKYGTKRYEEVVQMRTDIHNAIKRDLDE